MKPSISDNHAAPCVVERACGGWLAASAKGERLRIGVIGQTEFEARERYQQSIDRWLENLQAAGA